jgi:prepilin peptidase CpaA
VIETSLLVVFPALMAYAAASDLLTMTIPNKLSIALVVAFAAYALVGGLPWPVVAMHAGAGATVLVVAFALFAFGWIGGGDAKLAAAAALWLGFEQLSDFLILSSIAGGVLTIAILLLRGQQLPLFAVRWGWLTRLHDRGAGVPYGIALAGAALALYPDSAIWAAFLGA